MEEVKSQWINVKDKLPEHDQTVLVVFAKDSTVFPWYTYPLNLKLANFYAPDQYERFFRDKSSLHKLDSIKITHWMPVPKEPIYE